MPSLAEADQEMFTRKTPNTSLTIEISPVGQPIAQVGLSLRPPYHCLVFRCFFRDPNYLNMTVLVSAGPTMMLH